MNDLNNHSPNKIFTIIANNNTQMSIALKNGEIDHNRVIRYRDIQTKKMISFNINTNPTKVEVMVKFKNKWKPWVYVDHSTILNAGNGLFASRKFNKHEYFTIYMSQKLSPEDIKQGKFSKYAFED